MKKGSARKPNCHPNRKHYAKGLCAACYHTQAKKRKTKQPKHKEPVVVTHTHEVIRQVQLEETKMAEHDRPAAKAKENGKVTSDVGETEAPTVFGGDGVTPIAEWREKYAAQLKANAEKDEARRERAREDAGVIMTTAKGK